MSVYDDPNREALGLEPAWVEGDGGEPGNGGGDPQRVVTEEQREVDLDGLTKDELLEFAKQLGVSPANASLSKDELRAGIDEKLGS